jgi:hypothetical protein
MYNYFQLFILSAVIIVCIAIGKKNKQHGIKSLLSNICVFMAALLIAIPISGVNLFYDEMKISVENNMSATLDSVDFGGGIQYVGQDIESEEVSIKIPCGTERTVNMFSEEDCKVDIKIEKLGYNDSYILRGGADKERLPIYVDSYKGEMLVTILAKIVFMVIVTIVLGIIINKALYCAYKKSICLNNIKYEIAVFLYLYMLLLIQNPGRICDWVSAWYVLGYKDGIGSRLLIGTVLSLFVGDYVNEKAIMIFVFAALTLLIALVSILIGVFIRKSEKNDEAVIFMTAVYLSCPGSIAYLWTKGNMGRLETYSLIFYIIGLMIFEKCKNDYVKYFSALIFSVLALLTHQGTIFYYYPMIVTVIIYELFANYSLKRLILSGINFVTTFVTFIYLQLFSGLNYETLDTALSVLKNRTDIDISEDAVRLEYFATLKENFNYGQVYFFRHYGYAGKTFIALVMLMPLILLFVGIWKEYLNERKFIEQRSVYKSGVFYILLSNIMYLPIYLLMCDWGRWTGALVGTQFLEICYLYIKGDKVMKSVFAKLRDVVKGHKFICVIIVVYLANLDKFTDLFTDKINNLYYIITK